MNKKFVVLLTFILLFSFTSAQEHMGGTYSKQGAEYMDSGVIVNTLMYDVIEVNKNITVYMTPYELTGKTLDNSTALCRVGITSPDGSRLLLLQQSDFLIIGDDDIWTAVIPGSFLNETGEYLYNWDCQDGIRGGYFNSMFTVTYDGEHPNIQNFMSYIFLILIMIGLIGLVKYNHEHTEFDKWDSEIRSSHKNAGQTMVRCIVYNLFKNTFLWYYFLGWLIILTLNNIVFGYLGSQAMQYFTLIANVYSLGFFLVTIFMIGHTWSYIKNTFETITEDNWGVGE